MSEVNAVSTKQEIDKIVQTIVSRYDPDQVILFGSYAYGTPDADSDIDLLIIKDTPSPPRERRIQIRRLTAQSSRHTPFSPLVVTPQELAQRLRANDPFYLEITREGKLLYARE